jgi:uncharacterized membrane protein
VAIAVLVGSLVGIATAFAVAWQATLLVGWDAAAATFLLLTWSSIGSLDADKTARIAVREDPSTPIADLVIIGAGVASLGAVALVLVKAANSTGGAKALLIAISVASVTLSWAALHTVYTLRYARIFYSGKRAGIDFHAHDDDFKPAYLDFAYVAFTIGMTFQVSDTDLTSTAIRRSALRHGLLSFLFGAVILGLTINVVASLLH